MRCPAHCPSCGSRDVKVEKIDYKMEVKHDGALRNLVISDLEIPICQSCGEKIFTEEVDAKINECL